MTLHSSKPSPGIRERNRSGALADGVRLDMNRAPRRMSFSPDHPATRGAVGLEVDLDGERILALEVEIGHGHRGFEAQAEKRRWHQVVPYVERLQVHSSMMATTAYCLAVESLLGLEAPLRSAWLRVMGCELGRVADHLGRIASLAGILGADAPGAWALEARARVWELLELIGGAPTMHHYVRIGGVAAPLPPSFGARSRSIVPAVLGALDDFDAVLGQNRIFVDRLRGRAALPAELCLAYGVSGPLLRAAGVASDLRRNEPYLVYEELAFDLPVGLVGDNLDRYRVCVEEIRQGLGLVEQCAARLEALGPGEYRVHDPSLSPFREAEASGSFEERLQWATAYAQGPALPEGEGGARVESANGEMGFYLVADGGRIPRRVRCRAPGFFHAQALPEMLVGGTLADIGPTLALANIEGGECDR